MSSTVCRFLHITYESRGDGPAVCYASRRRRLPAYSAAQIGMLVMIASRKLYQYTIISVHVLLK